jgi:hypothetical protein
MSGARLSVVQRRDCELCEQMLAELERFGRLHPLPPIDLIDVDADPLLEGTVVCRHRLDAEELKRLLRAQPRER